MDVPGSRQGVVYGGVLISRASSTHSLCSRLFRQKRDFRELGMTGFESWRARVNSIWRHGGAVPMCSCPISSYFRYNLDKLLLLKRHIFGNIADKKNERSKRGTSADIPCRTFLNECVRRCPFTMISRVYNSCFHNSAGYRGFFSPSWTLTMLVMISGMACPSAAGPSTALLQHRCQ